jgi:hypothetical protein
VESVRRLTHRQLLAGTAVLILVGLALAYLTDITGNEEDFKADVAGFLIVSLVMIGVAAFLLLWLVPREEAQPGAQRPARTSLILGVLALITLIGFWTGLPFALGVPALYLGAVAQARAREDAGVEARAGEDVVRSSEVRRKGGGEGLAGALLGAAAVVLGLLACITG